MNRSDDFKKEDFTKTVRIEIPHETLEADLRRKQRGINKFSRILPPDKLQARAKEIAAHSIGNADIKALFDNLYDAALITNLEGNIIDANPRAVQSFFYTSNELSECDISDIVAGLSPAVLKNICQNLVKDQFTLIQAFCIRKDGSHFPAEISSSRMHLSASDYLCFFIRDITARREAEDEIRNARDEMERQVAERTKLNEGLNAEIVERKRAEEQLYNAILQLQQHDKAKSEFVSNVSHELKTPVASINYVAGNILKGITGNITDKTKTYLEMIREDCHRLSRTVEDILDMSRIEADTLKLKKAKINFARFARKTVESLRMQIEAVGLTIEIDIPDIIGFVECDHEKMERVLFNVVKNAIKYNNPDGFIKASLVYEETGYFRLDITDSGIGIEEKYLKKVTERFFRIGEHVSGAGLGLAITKEILEKHGGSIELQSPPPGLDKGTVVSLRLPVADPPLILAIYENEQNLLDLTKHLNCFGYTVISVKIGDAIEPALGNASPDIVTVDWISQGTEGTITISAIRNIAILEHIPVIAIIGETNDMMKTEILHGLSIQRLKTPWKPESLLNCIEQAVFDRK